MSGDKELYEKLMKFIQDSNDKQTKEIKEHIGGEIAVINKALSEEKEKRAKLEEKYEDLKDKYHILEKSLRKNNIIVFGLQTDRKSNLSESVLAELNIHLKLNLLSHDINNIYTIGKEENGKPVIIKFVSFLKKIEVLSASKNLKGTSISIAEDLSPQERAINKILRQHLKEARSKNLSTYIKNNKLYVSGTPYTAQHLSENHDQGAEPETINSKKGNLGSTSPTPTSSSKINPNLEEEGHIEGATEADKKRRKPRAASYRSSPRLNGKEVAGLDIDQESNKKEVSNSQ